MHFINLINLSKDIDKGSEYWYPEEYNKIIKPQKGWVGNSASKKTQVEVSCFNYMGHLQELQKHKKTLQK